MYFGDKNPRVCIETGVQAERESAAGQWAQSEEEGRGERSRDLFMNEFELRLLSQSD